MANFAENKKAKFDYEILDEYEGGLELLGHEVKSIRTKGADISNAHVLVRGGEVYLVGASIPLYQNTKQLEKYDPERIRRILLNKKEILELTNQDSKKGLTVVPISLYNKGRLIKIRFALVKGKKKFDKREKIKERDTNREMQRTLKNSR
jgi:SsrA-binding protein